MKLSVRILTGCLLWIISVAGFGQTTFTITDPAMGNSGSADIILAQAVTSANSGNNVTVHMNASALCNLTSGISMNITAGSLTIDKSTSATTAQGFTTSQTSLATALTFSLNQSIDVTLKDISIENAQTLADFKSGGTIICYNLALKSNVSTNGVHGLLFEPNATPLTQVNVEVKYCSFNIGNHNGNTFTDAITRKNYSYVNATSCTFNIHDNTVSTGNSGCIRVTTDQVADYLDVDITSNTGFNFIVGNEKKYGINYHFQVDIEYNTFKNGNKIYNTQGFIVDHNTFTYSLTSANNYIEINNNYNPDNLGQVNFPLWSSYNTAYGSYDDLMRMINTNSLSITPLSNNHNTFSTSSSLGTGIFGTFVGNEEDNQYEDDYIGLSFPGTIQKQDYNVIIRQCTIASSYQPNTPIISDFNPNFTISTTSTSGTPLSSVSVSYTIIDPLNFTNYGDTYIDFYKTNSNGDILDYLSTDFVSISAIQTASSNFTTSTLTRSFTFSIPSTVTVNPGERIVATITSTQGLGDNVYLGTSKAYYFFSSTQPCCIMPPYAQSTANVGGLYMTDGVAHGYACQNIATSFSLTPSEFACPGGPTTYVWDFGDGNTATGTSVSNTYSVTGTYTISISMQGSGCATYTADYFQIEVQDCCCSSPTIVYTDNRFGYCANRGIHMAVSNCAALNVPLSSSYYQWDFGDGTTGSGYNQGHIYTSPGVYTETCTLTIPGCSAVVATHTLAIDLCDKISCTNCIGSFVPEPGDYIISLWVREEQSTPVLNYSNTGVKIDYTGSSSVYGPFYPDNQTDPIIEGWQRIEAKFTVPSGATAMNIRLINNNSGSVNSYFDDIRVHPYTGNMKTYVFDPITLRLAAELDENNYATLYEYDEEGKLVRVKKETGRGIMSIKETRSANKKP